MPMCLASSPLKLKDTKWNLYVQDTWMILKLRNNGAEDNVMPQPPVYEEVISSHNLQNKSAHKRKRTHTPHLIV
jgi:uncharacterized protein YlaN (UPF0358 family)